MLWSVVGFRVNGKLGFGGENTARNLILVLPWRTTVIQWIVTSQTVIDYLCHTAGRCRKLSSFWWLPNWLEFFFVRFYFSVSLASASKLYSKMAGFLFSALDIYFSFTSPFAFKKSVSAEKHKNIHRLSHFSPVQKPKNHLQSPIIWK